MNNSVPYIMYSSTLCINFTFPDESYAVLQNTHLQTALLQVQRDAPAYIKSRFAHLNHYLNVLSYIFVSVFLQFDIDEKF